jgi:hypothetical protein
MNRLKFWFFALLVLAGAGVAMWWLSRDLRKQALDGIDRQLMAAQARAEGAERALTGELAAMASLAAQDERLAAALRAGAPAAEAAPAPRSKKTPPPPAPTAEQLDAAVDQAAAEAITAAQVALGGTQPGIEVKAMSREGFQRTPPADGDVAAFLQDGLDHKVRRGYAKLRGNLCAAAAVPLGDRGALAVFAPIESAWATAAVAGTGATLVLAMPGHAAIASNRQPDAEALVRSATGGGLTPRDAGSLAPLDLSPSWLPVQLPKVGSFPFLDPVPADRVAARPLAGVKGGQLVVAVATRPVMGSLVAREWYAAAVLVAAFLVALIFSFLIKPTEVAAPVPPALLDVARKIERGDFSARAPVMAGKVGSVAAALNRAAEAAQGVAPPASGPAPGSLTSEFFASAPAEPAPGPADPFALPSMPARTPRTAAVGEALETRAVADTARLDGANLTGAAFEAAPVAVPRPPPAAVRGPTSIRSPAPTPAPTATTPAPTATTPAADLLAGAARAAPAGEPDEEQHWRDVFRDFVRTRGECGESAEGLTYERFRQKLESNKSALVAKYGCKTVRFQVYVKDGKGALKATPVR